MKLLIQRSLESNVSVRSHITGKINKGLVVFVGFTSTDDEKTVDKMIDKLINLRVFSDNNGLMNLSLLDIKGEILSISQFTLYANTAKGRRPSFSTAMRQEDANELYEYFNKNLTLFGIKIEKGVFGADMKVKITNDGPVTILLDSVVC